MQSNLSTSLDMFLSLQEFDVPGISRQHMKVLKGQPYPPAAFRITRYTSYSLLVEVVSTSGP